jgi:hypothetical protein
LFFTVVFLAVPPAPAQTKRDDSWLRKIGRILGMDRTPLGLKGYEEEISSGDVWTAGAGSAGPGPHLLAAGDFRYPIIRPKRKEIFAMEGDMLVRIDLSGGSVQKIAAIPGVLRLVGFDPSGARFLALIASGPEQFDAVLFSPRGEKLATAAEKVQSQSDAATVVLSNVRTYGRVSVYAENNKIKIGQTGAPTNVDDCEPSRCGQPSYLPEEQLVIYVKTGSGKPSSR